VAYAFGLPGLGSRRLLPHRQQRSRRRADRDRSPHLWRLHSQRGECLEFALATNQEAGIWGGATEEERRKLRKAWLAKQRMVG
jgi:Transcription factor WhiB